MLYTKMCAIEDGELAQKITNKETNQRTNDEWKLEDVPEMWRAEVEAMLEQIVGEA